MLSIRAQNRMSIIPYKQSIVINSHDDSHTITTASVDYQTTQILLGRYKTKERALEVLDEIEIAILGKILIPMPLKEDYSPKPFSIIHTSSSGAIEQLPLVYQMPKER